MSDLEHGIRTVDVPITAGDFINGQMDPDRTTFAFTLACAEAGIELDRYTVGEAKMVARDGELFMRVPLHPGQEDKPEAPAAPKLPRLRVVGE